MTGGTLVLEVGGHYRAEDGYYWVIAGKIKGKEPVFIGYLPIGEIRDADCFFANGVSVTGRTKNLVEKYADNPKPFKVDEHPRFALEVGATYVDTSGYIWDVKHELYLRSRHGAKVRKYFAVNTGNGLVERYFNADGTFLHDAVEFDSPYPKCNLIRKVEPKRVEAGVGVGTKNVAEELYEMAKKHQTTEAVAQRLIERATEAAKNGETSIEVETYVFYDQRLQAELYKHGFAVKGKYIQSSFSASSSYLDKVYLSWGETGSKAGAK